MKYYPFLDYRKARDVFEAFVLPGVERALKCGYVKRPHIHIVSLDPSVPFMVGRDLPILFEHSIGRDKWEHPYDRIARSKASISWRTGLPSREVALEKPHLLLPGDTLYWGSAVVDGIVSAASAVEPYFDEMFARTMSSALSAAAQHQRARFMEQEGAPDFLPKHSGNVAYIDAHNRRGAVHCRDVWYLIEHGNTGNPVMLGLAERSTFFSDLQKHGEPIVQVDAGALPFLDAYEVLREEIERLEKQRGNEAAPASR